MIEPPPELLLDGPPPFTDDELAAMFEWADRPFEGLTLDEIQGVTLDPDPGPPTRWPGPRSDNEAAWALAKYAEAQHAIDEITATVEARIERLREWYTTALGDLPRTRDFFEHHLHEYVIRRREESGDKIKSLPFPDGVLKTRSSSEKVGVVDEPALVVWAKTNAPDAVKIAESILLAPLREATRVVEIPERVVLHPCAEVVDVRTMDDYPVDQAVGVDVFLKRFAVATAATCPSCGKDSLIARWHDTIRVVADSEGYTVPAVEVIPAKVTASIDVTK